MRSKSAQCKTAELPQLICMALYMIHQWYSRKKHPSRCIVKSWIWVKYRKKITSRGTIKCCFLIGPVQIWGIIFSYILNRQRAFSFRIYSEYTTVGSNFILRRGGEGLISQGRLLGHYFHLKLYRLSLVYKLWGRGGALPIHPIWEYYFSMDCSW